MRWLDPFFSPQNYGVRILELDVSVSRGGQWTHAVVVQPQQSWTGLKAIYLKTPCWEGGGGAVENINPK